METLHIEALPQHPVEQRRIELVERKGLGHPDTLCDAIMEQIAVDLCQAYQASFGRILHHNIDKGLLVAGRTAPTWSRVSGCPMCGRRSRRSSRPRWRRCRRSSRGWRAVSCRYGEPWLLSRQRGGLWWPHALRRTS